MLFVVACLTYNLLYHGHRGMSTIYFKSFLNKKCIHIVRKMHIYLTSTIYTTELQKSYENLKTNYKKTRGEKGDKRGK